MTNPVQHQVLTDTVERARQFYAQCSPVVSLVNQRVWWEGGRNTRELWHRLHCNLLGYGAAPVEGDYSGGWRYRKPT